MSEQVSKCCGAAVALSPHCERSPTRIGTLWFVCTQCREPCDMVQPAASAGGGAAELQKEQRP